MSYLLKPLSLSIIFVLFFMFSYSYASLCEQKTYVFFGNGMLNSSKNINATLSNLTEKLKSKGELSDDEWVFDSSYNFDEGFFSLFEVFRQRQGERTSLFWKWISGLTLAPDWFRDLALDFSSYHTRAEAIIDFDLRKQIDTYRDLLMKGHRILVIAHSQGNLYANAAYENLRRDDNNLPMSSFSILSVATPSSYVAGDGEYFTLTNDLVIGAVNAIYRDTLDGNVTNSSDDNTWLHHGFITSYLNGDQSGPLIINTALNEAETLPWPTPKIGNGPISVTLNWGDQPDLDLHVYEPDGTHVYYDNPEGPTGFIDHDDRDGYGPEHYYVLRCDSLTPGIYTIGVNYYKGEEPELARIQVKAGDMTRDYTENLPEAESSRGDSNPEIVAKVQISEDEEEGPEAYIFTVWGD